MAAETWILTDRESVMENSPWEVTRGDWMLRKVTLQGGLSQGVDVVSIAQGEFQVDVLPTRGMNIWQGFFQGTRLGWNSPVPGPVHPHFIDAESRGGLGWIAGCDEWIPRCGLAWMGAPCWDTETDTYGNESQRFFPLHGRISNLPAHTVHLTLDEARGEAVLQGVVDEAVFHGEKLRLHTSLRMRAGEAGFCLRDRIENIGGTPQGYQILYHTNFGPPLLGAGARLEARAKSSRMRGSEQELTPEAWNRYGPPMAGKAEAVIFHQLKADEEGWQEVVLSNPQSEIQASLRALQSELPYFTQWKNEAAEADGYVTGLEFGTGYPTSRKEEREAGRFRTLQPGESDEVGLSLKISNLP